jgi:hypothetical protein
MRNSAPLRSAEEESGSMNQGRVGSLSTRPFFRSPRSSSALRSEPNLPAHLFSRIPGPSRPSPLTRRSCTSGRGDRWCIALPALCTPARRVPSAPDCASTWPIPSAVGSLPRSARCVSGHADVSVSTAARTRGRARARRSCPPAQRVVRTRSSRPPPPCTRRRRGVSATLRVPPAGCPARRPASHAAQACAGSSRERSTRALPTITSRASAAHPPSAASSESAG